jgi:hypothetical protein
MAVFILVLISCVSRIVYLSLSFSEIMILIPAFVNFGKIVCNMHRHGAVEISRDLISRIKDDFFDLGRLHQQFPYPVLFYLAIVNYDTLYFV